MKDENLNHEFKGVWIPATIWLNTELSIQEKMLLVKIDSFKECFASNQYLADFMGLSVPRVKAIIGNLRKLEFIHSKEERKGNLTIKRTLYVDPIKFHGIARIENDTKVVLDSIRGRIENDTHSNTDNNKEEKEIKDLSATPPVNQAAIDCESVFEFWKLSMNKTARTILNKDRASKIKARLKEGYSVDEIKLAITNCSKSAWNMNNSVNDIEYICRNQQNLDKMLETTQHLSTTSQPTKSDMLLAGSSTQNVLTGQPLVTLKQGIISHD